MCVMRSSLGKYRGVSSLIDRMALEDAALDLFLELMLEVVEIEKA